MKKIMLTVTLLLIGTAIASTSGDRRFTDYDLDQIEEAYCISLGYDNTGVVESALYCIIKLHQRFPDRNFTKIKKAVYGLTTNGSNPLIRYKANIAHMYLNYPILITQLDKIDFEDGLDFWAMLVRYVQSLSHEQLMG